MRTTTNTLGAERDAAKRLRKRAARLKKREGAVTGESAPLDVWVRRLKGAGHQDLLDGFTCRQCGAFASWEGAGSRHRNHCPNCLHSIHLDDSPGDRSAACGAIMEPVAVWVRKGGEWALVHRCRECGELSSNRIAADDNPMLLMSIAVRPLASPPFPLERLDP